MDKKRSGNGVIVIMFFSLFFLTQMVQACAADEYRAQTPNAPYGAYVTAPVGYVPVVVSGAEYYYSGGSFYRRFGDAYLAAPAPVGAIVRTIPRDYKPIIIDGINYYIIHGSVYMQISNGYQVMPQKPFMIEKYAAEQKDAMNVPAQTAPSDQQSVAANTEESFIVNVPNSKNGYTSVAIKKSGNSFIGPQGERYEEFPKVEQLKAKYAN